MTMILPKYRPNFDQLTTEMAHHLASAMHLPQDEPLSGQDIFEVADEAGMDHADVVMCLATDPTVLGVQVVETLVGRPIVRRVPTAQRAVSRGPRRTVSVRRSDPRHIVYVSPTNPKKAGSASYDRFALYREGMTVDEFVQAGGTIADVKWDAERGHIRLEGDA
jgi:hypothetical protein